MAYPTITRTWHISTTRSTYASLAATVGDGIYALKEALLLRGYTMWASSDGTTGPTDANDRTDRIAASTNFRTRATVAAAAQSWVMVKDGNGIYILITYQGATDNVFRVSYSVLGYTLAATKTHQPTATDERVLCSTVDMVSATTSGDRLFHIWVSSDAKAFRVAVAHASAWVGGMWGIEEIVPDTFAAAVTFTPTSVGYYFVVVGMGAASGILNNYSANAAGFLGNMIVGGVTYAITCGGVTEGYAGGSLQAFLSDSIATLQGDYLITPIDLVSNAVGAKGRVGSLVDWWIGGRSAGSGDVLDSANYIAMLVGANPTIWPWNGSTPTMA